MSELATLSLARHPDAMEIAEMSRDLIEHGLAWSWTPARVRRAILGRDCCVLIARRELGHQRLRYRSVAETSSWMLPGSNAEWPASGTMRRSASGHTRCNSQALVAGQTIS